MFEPPNLVTMKLRSQPSCLFDIDMVEFWTKNSRITENFVVISRQTVRGYLLKLQASESGVLWLKRSSGLFESDWLGRLSNSLRRFEGSQHKLQLCSTFVTPR
jgi:hypothetical protein